MRPGQQNKRMRGRGRRGPSPLSRTYESNGPDVKIRGTASHIAEKYMQLARDAQASGDPVGAENYFQHAEHYFRIIAAAQAHSQQQNPNEQPRQRFNGADDTDDESEESTPQQQRGEGPQPPVQPQANADAQPARQEAPPRGEEAPPRSEEARAAPEQSGDAGESEVGGDEQKAAAHANGGQQPRRRRRKSSTEAEPAQSGEASGSSDGDGPAQEGSGEDTVVVSDA